MEVGLDLCDIVFDVDPATPRKKCTPTPTQFLAHVYCGQMAGWMKTPLGTEVDLGSGHIVLDGVPAPVKGAQHPPAGLYGGRPRPRRLCVTWGPSSPEKKATAPAQFLAHVYCDQTAGWMKTPLGTEVDVGPGHIVLDGVPALRERGTAAPSFRPMSIVATVAHLSNC